jgi:quinol monooxygenase YgiN
MTRPGLGLVAGAIAIAALAPGSARAAEREIPMVRIAELEIDPVQLDAYKALLAEEQEISVRAEPGVLMLHSVALADTPTHIRLLEVYASKAAYEAHIRSPHFVKYKTGTAAMVRSLTLLETTPIRLCSKGVSNNDPVCVGAKLGD